MELKDYTIEELRAKIKRRNELAKEAKKHPKQNFEKQNEQILANSAKTCKVEPKFKVGDFIVNDYCIGRIVEITNDAYLLDTKQGIPFSCNNTHLWDITKDAKDGDVLVSVEVIFIFNKVHSVWINCHCSLHKDESFIDEDYDLMHIKYSKEVYPATKEQRDTLFAKIKEAGYEWDAENKRLKKTEQSNEESNEGNCEMNGLYYAKAILEKTLGKVEGYKSDDGILEHKSAINAVTKLCEHKSIEIKDAVE